MPRETPMRRPTSTRFETEVPTLVLSLRLHERPGHVDSRSMEPSAVQAPTSPPARSRRRMFVVAALAVVFAGAAYITHATMQRDATDQALRDEMLRPLSPPPARLTVCKGAMDSACAQDAAERIGATVAWLDEPAGYQLEWMVANRHAEAVDAATPEDGVVATQYFRGGTDGRGMFEVMTSVPPLRGPPPPPRSRLVSNGTDTGSVWMDQASGTASVEWTHHGITYIITAQPRPWDPSAIVNAWKTVQYASPGLS
jgi:hypothetical protein